MAYLMQGAHWLYCCKFFFRIDENSVKRFFVRRLLLDNRQAKRGSEVWNGLTRERVRNVTVWLYRQHTRNMHSLHAGWTVRPQEWATIAPTKRHQINRSINKLRIRFRWSRHGREWPHWTFVLLSHSTFDLIISSAYVWEWSPLGPQRPELRQVLCMHVKCVNDVWLCSYMIVSAQ